MKALTVSLEASEEQVKEMEASVKKIGFSIVQSNKYKGTRIEDYFIKVRQHREPSETVEAGARANPKGK